MPRKASRRSAKSANRHGRGSRGGRILIQFSNRRRFSCRPSLRANRSLECAPDDRLREAIHRPGRHCERSEAIHRATVRKNGLLRCARNDGLRAMAQHGTPHSQSSSPANGSRECALDDRRRDAIHCPGRHCERSEAIHRAAKKEWIASLRSQ